jgi:hypothetical protein
MKKNIPTYNQVTTMRHLMSDEWELIVGRYPFMPPDHPGHKYSEKEKIYWKYYAPELAHLAFSNYDTIDCGSPKMERYRMSIMERYGWIKKTKKSWKILKAGREAVARYDEWWAEVQKKYWPKS